MRRALCTGLLLVLLGCDSVDDPVGFEEPFIATTAVFKHGELPVGTEGPQVTNFSSGFSVLSPGARNLRLSGNVTEEAYSVGARFAELGSGFWIQPVGSFDPITPGERTWTMPLDVSIDIAPGTHTVEVVAFDEGGNAGPVRTLDVCVGSRIPDNNNACLPKNAPPLLVASLTWDVDADLDLTVVAPDGKRYGREQRQFSENGKVVARLDADGTAGCVTDKRPMENFVWSELPTTIGGAWSIYANLFDACGKSAVTYTLTLYQRIDNGDGTFSQKAIRTAHGDFLRQQVNGGADSPVFITSVVL
ncbi:MAG: hypothetical protein ABW352_10255 [Polyangiales bacterium]